MSENTELPSTASFPEEKTLAKYTNARDIFAALNEKEKVGLQTLIGTNPDKKFGPKTYAALMTYIQNNPQRADIGLSDILSRFLVEKNAVIEDCQNRLSGVLASPNLQECEAKLPSLLSIAMFELGTKEIQEKARKYFVDAGFGNLNPRKVAWCSAFVNWVLQKAGLPGTYSLSARSFLGQSGKGHVGFKDGNNILGGNQSNMVSSIPARYFPPVLGYVIPTPTGLEKFSMQGKTFADIPNGAIVVCGRSGKNTNLA